jgi:TonB-linked SusC/RagA family outer membrane protein
MISLPKLKMIASGIICMLLLCNLSYAQEPKVVKGYGQETIVVKGVIQDAKDLSPLQGAVIQQEGASLKTATNDKGTFEIKVPAKSKLVVSMVGYSTIVVNAVANITVKLETRASNLEDVVVIGYGTQKKELLTGSVASMKFQEADKEMPSTMAANVLAGQMAGVNVSTPTGIPGQSAPTLTIRTVTTFNAAGQPVLYVIDGKIMGAADFNNLSPNDIDNISVLKDAASTAIYGSRGAGGVVLVTTKTGAAGKARINYSFNTGVDKRAKNVPLTSAVQAGELYSRINPTSDPAGWAWTQSDLDYFKNINNGWGYDQLGAVWRDPSTATHNLSVSGGTDKVRYYVGGSYVKQNGFLNNLQYEKYNVRANITTNLTKNFEIFAGVSLNNNLTYSTTNTSVGDPKGIYTKLLVWQPDQPVWTNTGKPIDYGWIANVGAETRGDGGYINSNSLKPVVNLRGTYKVPFIKGLSATANYSKSYTDDRTKYFQKQYTMYVMQKTGNHIISTNDTGIVATKTSSQVAQSYIQENAGWSEDKQLNLQLNYEHNYGLHHVKGWLVYERYVTSGLGMAAAINGFPVYTTDQWWAASTSAAQSTVSNSTKYSDTTIGRKSWVGQFFYDYAGKYMASFTYRYDGSMRFAPDQRWGFFPSGSVGWLISKESFFKVNWIDMLKLRASAGLVGNDAVGGWQWQESYKQGNSAYFGTSPSTSAGITYGGIPNKNLTWEKSLNKNIGVDMNFLRHFNTSLEYWYTHTYDILANRTTLVPPTFSPTLPAYNYGVVNAQGVDVSVGYTNRAGNIIFHTNITGSYGAAKYVLRDVNATYDYQTYNGRSTTYIAGYQTTGMLRTQDELDAFVKANPNYNFNGNKPALGQLVYSDWASAGNVKTPDGKIDSYDITILRKNNNPIVLGWNLGAEWKGFVLEATFNGMVRQWKSFNDLTGGVEWNRVWNEWYSDSWSTNTPNAWLPKRYSANDGTRSVNNSGSNFWYADGSFVRLKYLNLAYSLPAKYMQKIGVQGIRFYFTGANLFVISKFNKKYYDPEMGDGGTSFPIMKSFNFGASITL